MMVNLGKEKPSNDKKGHRGWYLPGSTWKRIERAVRKTWRSLIAPEWRSRNAWWEESRTQSEIRGAQGVQDQNGDTSYPGALNLPRQEECDCSNLSCSLSQSWGFRSGVEALLCPHLQRWRPHEAEAGASKASGRAGIQLLQKEGKAGPSRVRRFIREDLESSWLDL